MGNLENERARLGNKYVNEKNIYHGEIYDIHIEGNKVLGSVTLKEAEKTDSEHPRYCVYVGRENVSFDKEEKRSVIKVADSISIADYTHHLWTPPHSGKDILEGYALLNENGETVTSLERKEGYRARIENSLRIFNRTILDNNLLNLIFSPLDKRIIEFYLKYNGK